MAAMTSRFNIRCVIQYYSDQWVIPTELFRLLEHFWAFRPAGNFKIIVIYFIFRTCNASQPRDMD